MKNLHISPKIVVAGTIVGEAVAAFTLPEVLLTLTIVAVVASLTIPPLINNVQQAQFNSGAWTAYTMLSQAVEQIQINNGTVRVGTGYGTPWANNPANSFRDDICSVLKCVRADTDNNITNGGISYLAYKSIYNGCGTGDTYPGAILNNGMYLYAFNSVGTCAIYWSTSLNVCGNFVVDTNGGSGPNMIGDDLIGFWIINTNGVYSIIPMGYPNDTLTGPNGLIPCAAGTNSWTTGCTYQRLYNPNNMP